MSDVYSNKSFPFKVKDVIKVSLFYSLKRINSNEIKFSKVFYFKIVTLNSPPISLFFKIFRESFLIEGFCKIQNETIRWDKVKVESALKAEKIVLIRHLKSVYGKLNEVCDPNKGSQIK